MGLGPAGPAWLPPEARAVLAAFDRVTGLHLLGDIQLFVSGFEGMYEGFAERAKRADALLRADATAIVVVTTAETGRIAQAREFMESLGRAGLRVSAVVVNRAMVDIPSAAELERVAGRRAGAMTLDVADLARGHAGVAEAWLTLREDGHAVELVVRDRGRGFSGEDGQRNVGIGLIGIEERARLAGGEASRTRVEGSRQTATHRVRRDALYILWRGSSASRRPSPMKLMARTMRKIVRPGKIAQ